MSLNNEALFTRDLTMKKTLIALSLIATSFASQAAWKVSGDTDPMTGESQYYAISGWKQSLKPMGFPYQGTKSAIGVGCDSGGNYWAYFAFSSKPNMSDDDTQRGYSTANRRIKWDDEMSKIHMSQDHGSKFVHVSSDKQFIQNLREHNSVLLDMSAWHSGNQPYFKYSLSGSTKAINEALSKCGIDIPKPEPKQPKPTAEQCKEVGEVLTKHGKAASDHVDVNRIFLDSLKKDKIISGEEYVRLYKLNAQCF